MKKHIRFIIQVFTIMVFLVIANSSNVFGQLTVKILYNTEEVDPVNGCQGVTTFINTEVTGGSGDYAYSWDCTPANPFFVPSDDAAFFLASSAPGTFTVLLNVLDNISGFTGSKSITVIIHPRPLATIVANGPTTFCQGGSVELEETNGQIGVDYKWLKGGVEISGATSNKYSATQTGFYIAKVIYSSTGCFKNSNQISVTVNPNATISLTSAGGTDAQTKCINNTIDNITYAIGGGGTGASVTGLPAGVSGSFAGGTFTISGTPTASGTFNYTVTTSGTCTQTTANGSITVTPDATITLTSAVGTTNQTKCINTAIDNITYTIGGSGTGANVVGLPAGISGSFAAGIYTISGTPTVSGTFNYTVTTTGPCVQATSVGTININSNSTISLTSAPGTNIQTKCINTPIDNITYSVGGSGTGATVAGLPAGVSGSFAGGVYTISGSPTVSGTFNYTVTTTGPCVQATALGTITVTPDATINRTSAIGTDAQTKCINTAITNITYAIGGSGTGATVLGLPAGVTGVFAGGVFTISGTPTVSGLFNYTVTATGPCAPAVATGTINVNSNSTIALTSAAGTDAQVICINTPIVNITYAIGGSGTGATVTGLPAGVSGSFAAGVYTISGTPTASGTFNYTVTTTGPCVQATATGTITVTPNATISRTSAAGTDAQTLCINTALTNITYSIGVGGTGAIVSGLPAGVNGSYAGGVFTISGSPTASGTFNYTVTTTGPCVQASAVGTITVTPDATINRTSAAGTDAQVVCINTAIVNITYVVGGSGTGASVVGLPTGVSGSFAGGTFTITGTPSVSGTFNYTITTAGPCAQATASGTVDVTSNATITLSSAAGTNAQTVCINAPIIDITYSLAGGATGANVSGLPAGVTGSYAGGTFTISGTPTASGTFNYTVNTTGSCVQTSANGTITVNPNSTISRTSAVGTDAQSLCVNTLLTNITYAVGGSGTGATVSGLPAGVTGSFSGGTFTISGTPTASGTFNYTVTTTGPCTQAVATGVITVNPNATITRISAASTINQTVCINTPIANIRYSIGGGGTGAGVVGLPAGVTGSFAAGVFTISGTPTVSGVYNYTVTTTGTCVQATAIGRITVRANSTIALTSAPGTDAQVKCLNSPITNITYAIGGSGTGATVVGLPAGVSGSFAAGVFTISGTPTANGTFNYTVTTTGPCVQASAIGSIIVNTLPTVTFGGTLADQCADATIYALTGGTPPGGTYSSTIIGAVTGTNFNASIAGVGTHTITYTYSDGTCSNFATNTIKVNPTISNNTISTANPSICYNANAALTGLVPSGGDGVTYTYKWQSSTAGAAGPFADILDANATNKDYTSVAGITQDTWYRRVVSSGPCTNNFSNVIKITVGPIFTVTITPKSPKCVGTNDGEATANPVGGTPIPPLNTYTYSWDTSPVQTGQTATGLTAGIPYTVTVTDNIGCTATATVTLTDPAPIGKASLIVTHVFTCYSSPDGAIEVLANGGTPDYTYELYNGATLVNSISPVHPSTAKFNNLVGGSYRLEITDINSCPRYIEDITVNRPAQLVINDVPTTPISCNGSSNGTITINASGGTGPYTYSVTGPLPGGTFQPGNVFNVGKGTYDIVVMDANNCEATWPTQIIMKDPPKISFNYLVTQITTCSTDNTGKIEILNASGGSGSGYEYSIYQPAVWGSNPIFDNLPGGASNPYYVRVRDSNGCILTANNGSPIIIDAPDPITFDVVNRVNITGCWYSENGSFRVQNALGGTGDLKVSINGTDWFSIPKNFTLLGIGDYTVRVRDDNNCEITQVVSLTGPTPITLDAPPTVVGLSCNSVIPADGAITVAASGGAVGPLTYSIDGGAPQAIGNFTGLSAGDHTIRITDILGCYLDVAVNVPEPPAIVFTTEQKTNITCFGVPANGTITLLASGGTGALTYTLNPGALTSTPVAGLPAIFLNLAAGSYSYLVTDSKGCTSPLKNLDIEVPLDITVVTNPLVDINCSGGTGLFSVDATGGSGALIYNLYDNAHALVATNGDGEFPISVGGTYTVEITDANGCGPKITAPLTFASPSPIVIDLPIVTQMTSPGANDGIISVTANGGTPPLRYDLNRNGVFVESKTPGLGLPAVFSPLQAGTYIVDVVDSKGCSVSTLPLLIGLLDLTLTPTEISCNGNTDGKLVLTISGGTAPYTITWSNSAGPLPLYNDLTTIGPPLDPETYTVNVVDSKGIPGGPTSYTLVNPPVFDATVVLPVNDKKCFGDANGSVTFNIIGGSAPYTITWTEGSTPRTEIDNIPPYEATNVLPGTYSFTVTSASGCGSKTISDVTLTDPVQLNITDIDWNNPCFGQTNGSIIVTASGGTGLLTYTLTGPPNDSNNSGNFGSLPVGNYTILLTDANGCTATSDVPVVGSLAENPQINITAVPSPFLQCSYSLGSIDITVTGGTPSYTFSWNTFPAETTEDLTGASRGTYIVTVTDAANCSNTATATILGPDNMVITDTTIVQAKCSSWLEGNVDVGSLKIESVTGGTGPYTYSWDYPEGFVTLGQQLSNLSGGDYIFTIKDANDCIYSDTLWVPSDPDYYMDAYASKDTMLCGSATLNLVAIENDGFNPARTYTYSWYEVPNTGGPVLSTSKTFTINPTKKTQYYLEIRNDGGCFSSDYVDIDIYPRINLSVPPYISALQRSNNVNQKDTIIAILQGNTYNLDVITESTLYPTTFRWEPELLFEPADSWNSSIYSDKDVYSQIQSTEADRIVTLKDPETKRMTQFIKVDVYAKMIQEPGCTDSLRLYVKIVDNIAFGNVFSPNGDGINDVWEIPKDYLFPDLSVEIFNRWGAKVWSASGDKAARGWNGRTDNGKELPIGTYYYVVKFNVNTADGNWKPLTGSVTIIR